MGKGLEVSSFEVQTSSQSPGFGLPHLPSPAPTVPEAEASLFNFSRELLPCCSGVIIIEEGRSTFVPLEILKFCRGAWLPGR